MSHPGDYLEAHRRWDRRVKNAAKGARQTAEDLLQGLVRFVGVLPAKPEPIPAEGRTHVWTKGINGNRFLVFERAAKQ